MRWSEPQQAMLREMGLRLWLPPGTAVATPADAAEAPAGGGAPAARAEPPTALPLPAPPGSTPAAAPIATSPATSPASRPAAPALRRGPAPIGAPLAGDVATMDWPALRSAVAGCRACGLCETRRQTVFGVGHEAAHCMVVGEAPGEQEDAQGEPFVGESGRLLDRMLHALGLSRSAPEAADGPGAAGPARQVFIANTLKCRPPRNRNPSPEELATCQPFLQRQVALVAPRVILAMGRFAVQSLLGSDEPIGRLRGRVHAWRGVPLVVTYHPAYLLRQPADKARAWDDLCLMAAVLGRSDGV